MIAVSFIIAALVCTGIFGLVWWTIALGVLAGVALAVEAFG